MKKPAIAMLMLLVAAVATWWAWSNSTTDPRVAEVEIGAGDEGQDTGRPARATAKVADTGLGANTGVRVAVTAEVTPAARPKPLTFEIHVRRMSDQNPVPGAKVAICEYDDLWARYRKIQGARTVEAKRLAREEISHIARTDANGIVSVRLPIERAMIIVTHGNLWGRKFMRRGQAGKVEVLLDDDRHLRVRVLSSVTRQPVPEVPVGILANGSGYTNRTDAAGIATFEHVQEQLRGADEGRVGLALVLREPVQCAVHLDSLPQKPIELLMPPTGCVAIRVRDEKGQDVDCRSLSFRMEAFLDPGHQQTLPRARPLVRRLPAKGQARTQPMGLGLHLRLRISSTKSGSARRPVEIDFAGPTNPDEVTEQDVIWPSDGSPGASWPVISGRLVHNDGKPWVSAQVRMYPQLFPYDPKAYRTHEITTDDEGRFQLTLTIACPPGGKRVYHMRGRTGGVDVAGELDASRDFPDGVTDIGDVLLDQGRRVVSGRVVDQGGRPIARARIRVTQKVETNGREYWPTYRTSGSFWSDQEGSFACYQIQGRDLPQAALRLEVSHPETSQTETLPIALGQQGIRVEFSVGGGLRGSVLLGDTLEADDVIVLLITKPNSGRVLKAKADGSFEAKGVAPGLYTLIVRLRSASHELRKSSRTSIDQIRILPGEINSDPKLQGIRLAATGHKLRIRIRDQAGNPITKGRVELLTNSWRDSVRIDGQGMAVLLVPKLPIGVRVSSYGYSIAEFPALDSDRTVTLTKGLSVRLVTKAKTAGKNPSFSLGGFIFHVRENGKAGRRVYGREFPHEKVSFDSHQQIDCMLPGPGTYEFRPWFYYQSKDNVGRGGYPKLERFPRFTVRQDSKLQVFEIHIPEAAIQTELQRVRKTDTKK